MHAAIVTIEEDLHAFAVRKVLEERHGVRCDIIEVDRLVDTGGLSWTSDGETAVLPSRDGAAVDVGALDVVWWRRFRNGQCLPADVVDPAAIDVVSGDCRMSTLGVALTAFRGAWVSHPERFRVAENKLVQLRTARDVGFRVPATLVSQDPARIRSFCAALGHRVVVKSLTNSREAALTAARVRPEHLADERALRISPAIYQELVEGERHLRVHAFGDEIHAALITFPDLDWRYGLEDATVEPYPVPDGLGERIESVLRALGIRMGIFDFKYAPDGELVWLEVNPQGQFLFIEALAGMPLTTCMADFLVREARVRGARRAAA
jgi:hypothetical protein